MKAIKITVLIILLPLLAFSQMQEADDYESEFVWGINKNTSGGLIGGFMVRKSRRLSDRLYQSIGLEIVNLKHRQELQLTRSSGAGSSFIYGKSNYLYALRFQYGRELILFRKAPQQGVEIKLIGAVGPSIGLLAPYYIEWANDLNGTRTTREQFDINNNNHTLEKILGTGYVFQGIHESKVRLGANVKAALSFELGTVKSNVTGFEVGALLDAYTQRVELLQIAENRAIYPTAFITLFYGSRR